MDIIRGEICELKTLEESLKTGQGISVNEKCICNIFIAIYLL